MSIEENYRNLLSLYNERGRIIDELRQENNKLYNDLQKAEYQIRNELEPRIRQEKRSYDNWVTNPER